MGDSNHKLNKMQSVNKNHTITPERFSHSCYSLILSGLNWCTSDSDLSGILAEFGVSEFPFYTSILNGMSNGRVSFVLPQPMVSPDVIMNFDRFFENMNRWKYS